MQEASKPKPRLQFGIRTLLLFVAFASIPTAWIANDVKKSHDRDAAEHEWNRRGANVNFAPDRRIVWLGYRPDIAPEIGDDDLLLLEEAPHVEYLDLRDTAISDAGLRRLHHLEKLYGVNLAGTGITDAGLRGFHGMKQIRILDVRRTKVTADGVEHFQLERPDCEVAR